MMFNCPICGKRVFAHWPEHWVYRRGPTYYCSDQCMDVDIARDTKLLNTVLHKKRKCLIMNGKITLEMKKKAAEIAISGNNPLPYLKQCGAKNPSASWKYIRDTLERVDPETFAKLPDRLPKKQVETPEGDWTPAVKVYGPVKIETPEPEKVEVVKSAGECMADMQAATDEFFGKCGEMGLKLDGPKQEEPKKISIYPSRWKAVPFTIRSVETPAGVYTVNNGFFEFKSMKDKSDAIEMKVEDFVQFAGELPTVMEMLGVAVG